MIIFTKRVHPGLRLAALQLIMHVVQTLDGGC